MQAAIGQRFCTREDRSQKETFAHYEDGTLWFSIAQRYAVPLQLLCDKYCEYLKTITASTLPAYWSGKPLKLETPFCVFFRCDKFCRYSHERSETPWWRWRTVWSREASWRKRASTEDRAVQRKERCTWAWPCLKLCAISIPDEPCPYHHHHHHIPPPHCHRTGVPNALPTATNLIVSLSFNLSLCL